MGFEQNKDAFFETGLIKDAYRANCENELLTLQKFLKENDVIVLKTARAAFKKKSILIEFCRIFFEKFNYYLEEFPILKQDLHRKGISHNLVEELTKNSTCHDFSESIYQIYNHHSTSVDYLPLLQRQNEECKSWIQALEFLYFIYEITHLLAKGQLLDKKDDEHHRIHTRRPKIDWCAFCFRRVQSIGEQRPLRTTLIKQESRKNSDKIKSRKSTQLTCNLHKSTNNNDSIYRAEKRFVDKLSFDDLIKIDEIRAFRRYYEVINFKKDVNILEFEKQWQENKSLWLNYLYELCPHIPFLNISTWGEYTKKFHELLQNDLETTQIPTIIQDIYFEVKIWDSFKKRHLKLDNRRKKCDDLDVS
ncbi:hypothetical protein [Acinetobacter sp. Leaf130]|uniref:hypothetical protein n=1 Tax=Acinetobacter sp. Leaf130 TaxID=1736269 RepID=UPI0006F271E3|nr:hypothetical protein [Acinetobacter sp. Leaf130]KQQ76747.1 hypothetical protein ASF86_04380 [Acinetobacter sp. Leaf130]